MESSTRHDADVASPNKRKQAEATAATPPDRAAELHLDDLPPDALGAITEHLDPLSWFRLRRTCRALSSLPKSPPNFRYKVIYGALTCGESSARLFTDARAASRRRREATPTPPLRLTHCWHYLAETLGGAVEAARTLIASDLRRRRKRGREDGGDGDGSPLDLRGFFWELQLRWLDFRDPAVDVGGNGSRVEYRDEGGVRRFYEYERSGSDVKALVSYEESYEGTVCGPGWRMGAVERGSHVRTCYHIPAHEVRSGWYPSPGSAVAPVVHLWRDGSAGDIFTDEFLASLLLWFRDSPAEAQRGRDVISRVVGRGVRENRECQCSGSDAPCWCSMHVHLFKLVFLARRMEELMARDSSLTVRGFVQGCASGEYGDWVAGPKQTLTG